MNEPRSAVPAGTTNSDDPCEMSIDELRSHYASRSLSPVEVVKAHLGRIRSFEDQVNAFVTVTEEHALDDARRAEKLWAENPQSAPPLAGIPYALKDLVPTAGIRTTRGSLTSENWIPEQNSPLAERILSSGGALLGKTTTSEVGWKADAGNRVNGPSRNPYDARATAGGSSGGAAAAVAARMATVTQGGDGAGSVRIPASFCGVVGIKPGPGVIPYFPPTPLTTIVANGSFGRSVRDAATLLDVMSGPDPRDSLSVVRPSGGYLAACDEPLGALRIAYAPTWGGRKAEPEIESNIEAAVQALADAGHHVDIIESSPQDRFDLLHVIWTTGFASIFPGDLDSLDRGLADVITQASEFTGADLAEAHLQRRMYQAEVSRSFADYDVLITPTAPVTAFPAGADGPTTVNGEPANYLDWAWLTYSFNLSEHPAISIPSGLSAAGLPIGMQLVGHHGGEQRLVAAAAACERVLANLG